MKILIIVTIIAIIWVGGLKMVGNMLRGGANFIRGIFRR